MSSDTTEDTSRPVAGLELRGVTVRYGDTVAVDDVDLDVAPGEIVALLGPSGCGKSTLLRAIAGLEPLAAGSVRWHAVDQAGVAIHERRFGLMFQDHALFPHRDVAANVAFGLRMRGVDRAERLRRVDEMLELVGLGGMGERTIGTLSGGQAQRVALARALAPAPDLLLLDEPLASLDRTLRDRLVGDVRSIVVALGNTAVHVTHDQDEAASIGDRIALMEAGRIRRTGGLESLRTDPGDSVTARLLGLEALLRVPITDGIAGTPFGPVERSGRAIHADDGHAHLLIPPEAVNVTGVERGVEAEVRSSRYRSGEWLVRCRLADGTEVVAVAPQRRAEGERVGLVADLSRAVPLERGDRPTR